jgi:Cys-tRNA(Pro)/Cys-tRNA(Cys) deacylase
MHSPDGAAAGFQVLVDAVKRSGVPFVLHEHAPTRTVEDARSLPFDSTRIVKTVAFHTANAGLVLAALRGSHRVDYAKLAALVGVNRRELASLSPEQVRDLLGVEPGSVSPVPLLANAVVYVDEDVLTILPTLYCGIGRCDRTLEIAPTDLLLLTGDRVASLSRTSNSKPDRGS